jgi:hypothetical protein
VIESQLQGKYRFTPITLHTSELSIFLERMALVKGGMKDTASLTLRVLDWTPGKLKVRVEHQGTKPILLPIPEHAAEGFAAEDARGEILPLRYSSPPKNSEVILDEKKKSFDFQLKVTTGTPHRLRLRTSIIRHHAQAARREYERKTGRTVQDFSVELCAEDPEHLLGSPIRLKTPIRKER